MKKFESVEVFQPSSTGNGGGASNSGNAPQMPFGQGYYQTTNNGAFGIHFTSSGQPSFKTYKNMKHSKKNLKRMKKFKKFVKENLDINEIEIVDINFYDDFNGFIRFSVADKTQRDHFRIYPYGNVAFDGFYSDEIYNQLVAYVYENLPEGDLKNNVEGYYELSPLTEDCATAGNTGSSPLTITASQPSNIPGDVEGSTKGTEIGKPFGTTFMKTGAYGFNSKKKKKKKKNESLKHIKMFEEYKDKVTFCLTGSPKPYWATKAEFVEDMEKWGYDYTTLTKNTDMLIAADTELGTLKCQKAEKYGIPIYTYKKAFDQKERLYKRVIRGKKIENIEKNKED